jgi:hypothetical protein
LRFGDSCSSLQALASDSIPFAPSRSLRKLLPIRLVPLRPLRYLRLKLCCALGLFAPSAVRAFDVALGMSRFLVALSIEVSLQSLDHNASLIY